MKFSSALSAKKCKLAAVAICCSLAYGCSNSDNTSDGGNTPGTPDTTIFSSDPVVTLQVIAANGAPQDDALVEVIRNPASIISTDSLSESTGTNNNGTVTLEVEPFEGTNEIQVRVTKDGFMANNVPVTVAGGQDTLEVITITADLTDDVIGIGSANDAADITQSMLTATATGMSSATENTNPASSTVMIPQNSAAQTRDGTPLGNQLTMSVVHYDADQEDSLLAFPGGFATRIANPDELAGSGLATIDGGEAVDDDGLVFESVGFVAIEVRDEQDRIASTFDQPIEITTEIKPNTPHPTADPARAIQAGDEIPIWSFDETTGEWSYEQTGTVQQSGDGTLFVKFTTDHLSYYNLDFYGGNLCTITLNFVRADSGAPLTNFTGILRGTGFSRYFRIRPDFEGFRRAPSDKTLTLSNLRNAAGDEIIANPSSFSCGGANSATVNVSLEIPVETPTFPVTVSAETFCSNIPDADPVPVDGAYVSLFRSQPNVYAYDRTDATGVTNLGGVQVTEGNFTISSGVYLDGRWTSQSANVALDASNNSATFRFPQTCEVLTTGGSGTGG
jgi:hypothetical protein